jgi:hypothetical protein
LRLVIASLDVNKFLHLELDNNLTILQNLEQNTDYIKTQFEIDNFDEIRSNFLASILASG